MSQHEMLDNQSHGSLKVARRFVPGCGFDLNVARVYPMELSVVQRDYPVFLLKNPDSGDFETVALLGFDEGENLYLGGDRWLADYIPLTIERQPFLIGFQEQEIDGVPEQVPVVHVDMAHPSISSDEGVDVFLPEGGETEYLQYISRVLKTINDGQQASREFSQMLVGLELVESVELNVEFHGGVKTSLKGLFTVNEERLRDLSADALGTLHKSRGLQNIYMMLASMTGVSRLIDRKNAVLKAAE